MDATTNKLTNSQYDLNGNMTTGVGATFSYDEANRLFSAALTSGGVEYYGYAPDNKRVYRLRSDGTEEWTLYGAKGEKLLVYRIGGSPGAYIFNTPASASVWFAGRLISENSTYGMFSASVIQDRLGTNRVNGARFYPYGEEIGTATANDHVKFGTYNRDGYTGLDYADQRYYASAYGRFDSPDPYKSGNGAGTPADPLSWNKYAYVEGDPINFKDPSGLFLLAADDDDDDPPDAPLPTRPTRPGPVPTAQQVYDRSLTQQMRRKLKTRIDHLGNCTKILGGGTAADLLDVANQIQYFNGSSDAPGSGRTQQAVSNNGNYTTLAATVSGSVVASTLTWQGHPIGDVVLGTDFKDPTVSQPDVLLHEALHFTLGLDDAQLKTWLAGYGFQPQQYGTDDITQWLKANCPDQNK